MKVTVYKNLEHGYFVVQLDDEARSALHDASMRTGLAEWRVIQLFIDARLRVVVENTRTHGPSGVPKGQ